MAQRSARCRRSMRFAKTSHNLECRGIANDVEEGIVDPRYALRVEDVQHDVVVELILVREANRLWPAASNGLTAGITCQLVDAFDGFKFRSLSAKDPLEGCVGRMAAKVHM